MLQRAPLLLAAGLFFVGVAGLFVTTTSPGHTTPFVAPQRQQTTVAPFATNRLPSAPERPLAAVEAPLATSAAAANEPSSPAVATESALTPATDPRLPVVAAAVASDSTHELAASPTPGVKLRTPGIGRDESPTPER